LVTSRSFVVGLLKKKFFRHGYRKYEFPQSEGQNLNKIAEKLAVDYGLTGANQFLTNPQLTAKQAQSVIEKLEPAGKDLENSFKKALTRLPKILFPFVRDVLKLPWPWVAEELLLAFSRIAYYAAWGATCSVDFGIKNAREQGLVLPKLLDNESWLDYSKRLAKLAKTSSGRQPKGGGQQIVTYVEWFYRNRFEGESVRKLAKAYREQRSAIRKPLSPNSDSRQMVQYGIAQAKLLLAVPPYAFKRAPLLK
jgi:hypothetical protein